MNAARRGCPSLLSSIALSFVLFGAGIVRAQDVVQPVAPNPPPGGGPLVIQDAPAPGPAAETSPAPAVERKRLFFEKYLQAGVPLDDAIALQLEMIAKDSENPGLHIDLGNLLIKRGFPKDARRQYERALDIDKKNIDAWFNLGLTRELLGNRPGALRAYKKVVRLKSGHALAHYQIGRIYETRGSEEAAITEYARAFAIDPALLEVRTNPFIVDNRLVAQATLRNYPRDIMRDRMPLRYHESDRLRALLEGKPDEPRKKAEETAKKPRPPRPPAPAVVAPAPPAAARPQPVVQPVVQPVKPLPVPIPDPASADSSAGRPGFAQPGIVAPQRSPENRPPPRPTDGTRPRLAPPPPPPPPEEPPPPKEDPDDYPPYPIEIPE